MTFDIYIRNDLSINSKLGRSDLAEQDGSNVVSELRNDNSTWHSIVRCYSSSDRQGVVESSGRIFSDVTHCEILGVYVIKRAIL